MREVTFTTSLFFQTSLVMTIVLPLLAALLIYLITKKYVRISSMVATLLLLISTLAAVTVFIFCWNNSLVHFYFPWFSIGSIQFTVGIYLTNVSVLMLVLVTFISFLVHVYSLGYMKHDNQLQRYMAMLGFFTFAMIGIVLADNLLLIFIFWELVGFASYRLIGHWQTKPSAAAAAKKAFVINRIGDAGFLIGLMLIWTTHGTFSLTVLETSSEWQTVAALCIFCGVIGKSAQFPLLTWLPDAMEGPTPVSALIHAATMVAAGVYLVVRTYFLFTIPALHVVLLVGCTTATLGAFAALAQTDLKKILAYSTISQLGLMMMALGAGSPAAAMFHLVTHAFFKACLFLGAGAIIHTLHEVQQQLHSDVDVTDVRNLGGLRKKTPLIFYTFLLSGSALAGLPFFSGFLSKDAILSALYAWQGDAVSWRWSILGLALIVSFITMLYTFRLLWNVFMGEEKTTLGISLPSLPGVIKIPLVILAALSCWIIVSWNPLDYTGWLWDALPLHTSTHHLLLPWLSAGWVLFALAVAYATRNRQLITPLLAQGFYLNQVYTVLIEKPVLQLTQLTTAFDKKWIDGFVHSLAYGQVMVAHLTAWFDRNIIDGTVDGVAVLSQGVGSFTRSFQGGKIQLYIFWAVLSIIIFLIWALL